MDAWRVLRQQTVFEAEPFVSVSCESVALPDGRQVDNFYKVHLRPFALIVPIMEDGRVLLLRQYKHGPGCVSLTFPAGHVEDGEAPLVAAQREFLEETGCAASDWQALGSFVDHGNQVCSVGHYYLAHGVHRVQAANSGDLEEMEELFLSPQDLDAALFNGGFAIAHHVVGWGLARAMMGR